MSDKKCLIVNADDFGLSAGVNRGVIRAHQHGILTSASLMVRWPAAREAASYRTERPDLSVGLHLDLGEWTYREGAWMPLYEVVSLDDVSAVADEVYRQLATFRRLLGHDPTHLDSHQHVHRREPVRSLLMEAAHELGVPLRHCSPEVRYCGDFYGQAADGSPLPDAITAQSLIRILEALPAGLTELCCHPGDAEELDTMYRSERAQEVKAICDRRVRATITEIGIELRSFGDLAALSTMEEA